MTSTRTGRGRCARPRLEVSAPPICSFRGLLLEDDGRFAEAADCVTAAAERSYHPSYLRASRELRRVVRGRLAAVTYFAGRGAPARVAARRAGILHPDECTAMFEAAGWSVTIENQVVAPAAPTPRGEIVEGGQIDAFPAEPTELTWCVLLAT